MAISTISLNLKNTQSLQPKQLENTQISSAFSQRPQQEQPKVLYQMNTIPVENGIKSSSIFEELFTYTLSDDLNNIAEIETPIVIDSDGTQGVVLIEIGYATGNIFRMYMRPAIIVPTSDLIKFLTYTPTSSNFLHKRYTLFQNRTLMLSLNIDTYNVTVTGDTPLATKNAVMEFDFANGRLINHNLTGIDLNNISLQGIVSFENYLIFFTRNTIFWSNPLDFTDFVPAVGGAGSEKIAEARGDIITITPSANGFIIYCRGNIVHAAFSGDVVNPWVFNEIPNSSGLMISNTLFNARALVATNEQQQVQYALLTDGLSAVTETVVEPVAESLREYISASYIEDKVEGASIVTRELLDAPNTRINKLQSLYSYGTTLFLVIGEEGTVDTSINRILIVDFQKQAYGTIKGDFKAMHPRTTFNIATINDNNIHLKAKALPRTFTLCRKGELDDKLEPMVLDFGSLGDTDMSIDALTDDIGEVLIGQISISKDRNTIVHSIELTGRLVRVLKSEGGAGAGVDPDTVKVFVFSNLTQTDDTPVEFTYNPADNKYYGYMEGKDIKVLIQGKNFYLTKFTAEIEDGGII